MSQFFPSDITNYSDYDMAKCYNSYDNVEGVSSSKHVPWRSSVDNTTLFTSNTNKSCTNSMVHCRAGNLIDDNPYDIITKTTKTCSAPPNYTYFNPNLSEMIASFDRISANDISDLKSKIRQSTLNKSFISSKSDTLDKVDTANEPESEDDIEKETINESDDSLNSDEIDEMWNGNIETNNYTPLEIGSRKLALNI